MPSCVVIAVQTGADRFQYLAVLAACVLVTLPLELVIGARVYRRPRRLLAALAPAVAVFVAWDVVAIDRGHWWYNPRYVTGWRVPGALPVEELAFFVVVPICALLTYEAVTIVLAAGRRVLAASRRA
jgi:lycopene cyclase domain-containing protein